MFFSHPRNKLRHVFQHPRAAVRDIPARRRKHATCNMQHARLRAPRAKTETCKAVRSSCEDGNMQHATCKAATCNMQGCALLVRRRKHAPCNMQGCAHNYKRFCYRVYINDSHAECTFPNVMCDGTHAFMLRTRR